MSIHNASTAYLSIEGVNTIPYASETEMILAQLVVTVQRALRRDNVFKHRMINNSIEQAESASKTVDSRQHVRSRPQRYL